MQAAQEVFDIGHYVVSHHLGIFPYEFPFIEVVK